MSRRYVYEKMAMKRGYTNIYVTMKIPGEKGAMRPLRIPVRNYTRIQPLPRSHHRFVFHNRRRTLSFFIF